MGNTKFMILFFVSVGADHKAIGECIVAYIAIIVSLITGKMMLEDRSDLPPHLQNLD